MEYGVATLAQGLIAAWTLVAVAFLALGILVYVALRGRARGVDLEKAVLAFRSLDIEAFRNLVDSEEEAFLRNNLSSKKFREIKRQRAWAAFIYAREAGHAATALAKVGQAAQRSSDPEIAASGAQIAESAFRLRLETIGACLRLLTEVVLPGLQSRSLPTLADQYERATETLLRLGRFSSGRHGLVSR
ncbi:MAG: hypothetical protein WBD25_13145 [Terriglobales bacterium]